MPIWFIILWANCLIDFIRCELVEINEDRNGVKTPEINLKFCSECVRFDTIWRKFKDGKVGNLLSPINK